MTVKTKRISTLIESQLPQFISTEYELFGKFVQKYYESQEVQGGPLDIISNIQKYFDIDFYDKNLLKESDVLSVSVSSSDTTITLEDASSFPEKNGYVKVGNEIVFYTDRNDTELLNCSRGVSGNTKLGDLYDQSNFVTTESVSHSAGERVYNVSNLFLYAFVKNFESQYLGSFPEKYLKGEVDKRTLIKNIQKFYKAKGTESSIKFVFNTIVAKDVENKPSVYNPRDFTYKASESDWVNVYALKVKVVFGDPNSLIGTKIEQIASEEYDYASATVDNVYPDGTIDGEEIWNIVLAPETVNGSFFISTKTRLEKLLPSTHDEGNRIDVFSTIGWDAAGKVLVGEEVIEFADKNATQFIISKRGDFPVEHEVGTPVYKPVLISGSSVDLLTLGVVYNILPENSHPYSFPGDTIQVSNPGFETEDRKIIKTGTKELRWLMNTGSPVSTTTNISLQNSLDEVKTNVSAIFSDEQYYYIASSGFPAYNIFDGTRVTEEIKDQKILKIIRKEAITTTEVYKTPKRDVGILLNGVPLYSFRDEESIRYGSIDSIEIITRGRNYEKPPFVLIDGLPNKARAVMTGQVVDRIVVDTKETFIYTPEVEIVSGRKARVSPVITGGKVTSLVIDNPGEYYSSPPTVVIRDLVGRGRFAEYTAIINTQGQITGFNKISEGNFYTNESTIVEIIPVGEDASAIANLKEWNKNRFVKLKNNLDTQFGYFFENQNKSLAYGYGQIANPKALRVELNDNLSNSDLVPQVLTHSPIIGFAYDGNPIYGPYGYTDPLNSNSAIARMTSSYSLNGSRVGGPSTKKYPLGTFTNDYTYVHKSGSLDRNNGRFCVTPDFPEGVYAYFITIDNDQNPKFPYILGENFYSLPVDSNYNSEINQNDIPRNSKRYFSPGMPRNGDGLIASVSEVTSGGIDRFFVERSSNNFSPNSKIYFNNRGTDGSNLEAVVSSVKGKNVNYLESKEDKVVKLTTIQNAYLFTDDTLRQPNSGASGQIVGTVQNDNVIVLKNVVGTFNNTGTFSADIKTFVMVLDQDSSYTKGSILNLTDGINSPVATGEVLEGTIRQNTVQIKVLSGIWSTNNDYFIQSSNLFDTSGTRISVLTSLSDNLEPFEVNQSVALIETSEEHGLGVGDDVIININPDDNTKTKDYFVRKRLYQNVKFKTFKVKSSIDYNGIGRFTIMNGGAEYTPGLYTDVPLTGGSGTGATAIVSVSSEGVVSDIQLESGGSDYKRGDLLSIDDSELQRAGATLSTSRFTMYIDHAGISLFSTEIKLKSSSGFSSGDLVKIGNEIVKVVYVSDNTLFVLRGQEGTEPLNHYNNQEVSVYKQRYNFTSNFQIFNSQGTGYVQSYDPETQEATIIFDYNTEKSSAIPIQISTSFFDSSTPKRLVRVSSASEVDFKFEFSEDNTNFTSNPIINIQEFYRYKFDTSHSSMTGTYFDLSPSKNFNLITLEKTASTILPGNPGSFTDVKFGFGSRIGDNLYTEKKGTDFTNFYYFDNKNVVNSDGGYLKVIQDPLQGSKKVNYVTPNRFVYDISAEPLWDGSGVITYTTSGQFSSGEINTIKVLDSGDNYKKVPTVVGCSPSNKFKGEVTVLFDDETKVITDVRIDNVGSNYSKPKAIIVDGDGVGAEFDVIVNSGSLFSVNIKNPGTNYTYAPKVEIIESDVEIYLEGDTIGVPRSVSITRNGGSYHLDETISSKVTSQYVVSLSSISGNYRKGETVTQTINGTEVARAVVSEWRPGSNLLKLRNIEGTLRQSVELRGNVSKSTAILKSIFVTNFKTSITSFYDNLGYYTSDRGKIGVANQKLTDSFFYQDYSYVVKSKTSINDWRDLIKSTTHPAGFKLFGQVDIEGSASTTIPSNEDNKSGHFSIIQLWDPEKNTITVENTTTKITQNYQILENYREKRSVGSASSSEFDFNESTAFHFTLSADFDGYYDKDGILQGTTTFQMLDPSGSPFFPPSAKNLIITLDGILQEPDVAYTISGSEIIFSKPPLGDYQKLTGNNLSEISQYKGVKFYGRYFRFNVQKYNDRYFRKIRNIFQRNGRWIDAANQIERNKEFIILEAIGYGREKHPNLDWRSDVEKYQEQISNIVDAYAHDIRFGGNVKVTGLIENYISDSDYNFITRNKAEALDIFLYASALSKLAMRNWDITEENIIFTSGSNIATLSSTSNLVIGMSVLSDVSFDGDVKILSIDSDTQITLNVSSQETSSSNTNIFYLENGNWSIEDLYINNTIIADPLIPAQECNDVASSIDALYENISDILLGNRVETSLPDYIDGENKVFDLYWEDGTEVITDTDEDLFLTINAVLQRPKYNEDYPGEDSYYIDRETVPNRVVFDVAPIWDQDLGAKTIGEPTAVEKVSAVGVGNYKRLTIDKTLVDGTNAGPFLILDVEDNKIQDIEDDEYLYVFIDGILQRKGYTYTISGPSIYFNIPIKPEMKIDMRYLYGRDVGQVIRLYDFSNNEYFARSIVSLETTSGLDQFLAYYWMGEYRGFPIQAYQIRQDGSYNILGEISNLVVDGSRLDFACFGFECDLDVTLDVTFAVKSRYNLNTVVSISSYSITYERDIDGRIIISTDSTWSGTDFGKFYRSPFVSLSNRDLIKIDGEDKFRRIKRLPTKVVTREQREQEQVSNTMFGTVDVERYNGVKKGEGLTVIAIIENGSVVRLEWNQRNYEPLTQPTAYGYFTPPVLNFIPVNGEGGGARASVLVSKGQVISVDLIDGGSGYTETPKVEVSRKYSILSERDIGISVINVGINPYVERAGMLSAQTILDAAGSIIDYSSISFESAKINDNDKTITTEVQLIEKTGDQLIGETALPIQKFVEKVVELPLMREETTITAQVQGIISSTIISTNRQFTSTSQNVIQNDIITNVIYYATGAYLDISLDLTDTIVYIPNTSKFIPSGYLMIGDEVVKYERKLSDRFLEVDRGQNFTTAKAWPAGTFVVQIPEPLSVTYGGVSVIESQSQLVSLSGGTVASSSERITSIQSTVSQLHLNKEVQIAIAPPTSGITDGYSSNQDIIINDPLATRNYGIVDLIDDYEIDQRNGNTVLVSNNIGLTYVYIGNYIQGNVGPGLGNFDKILDDGVVGVSAMSIQEIDWAYPLLTLGEIEQRSISSYTSNGQYFNIANNSIQNPVTISTYTGSIGGTITVQSTAYFPDSGYLFSSGRSLISYTGKTATSFTGCTLVNGSAVMNSGNELIPYIIK